MAKADEDLLEAAKRLHFAAGEQWNNFLTALKAVETEAADALVRSPQEHLSRVQGRAQMVRDLHVALSKA